MKNTIKYLDATIINLLQERERLLGAITQGDLEQEIHGTSRLFTTPFAVNKSMPVHAYEEFIPGYCVGYEADKIPAISVRQENKANTLLSPPDHHFTFNVAVTDHAQSRWITLERDIGSYNKHDKLMLNISVKAKATMQGVLHLSLALPVEGNEPVQIPVDTVTLKGTEDYTSMIVSKEVDLSAYDVASDESKVSPRLTLFFPVNTNALYTLSLFTVLVASEG